VSVPVPEPRRPLGGSNIALGSQLALSMLAFVGIGYGIDYWLGTLPVFVIVGALFGLIAFFAQIYRVMVEMNQQDLHKRKAKLDQTTDKS
jgi:F0F1-type ATP synthase assembly protein I